MANEQDLKSDLGGQPRGLFVTLASAFWVQASLWGLLNILPLYLTENLFLDAGAHPDILGLESLRSLIGIEGAPRLGSRIFILYTSLSLYLPALGAFLSDRRLGHARALRFGFAFFIAGSFLLGWERLFLISLLLIALGTALCLPNLYAQASRLFEETDSRREPVFIGLYLTLILGTYFGPILFSQIFPQWGPQTGMMVLGLIMALGFGTCLWGQKRFEVISSAPNHQAKPKSHRATIYCLPLFMIAFVYAGMDHTLTSIINLWSEKRVDLRISGWDFPTTWSIFVTPFGITFIALRITRSWKKLAARQKEPSPLKAMSFATGLLAVVSFLMLMAFQVTAPDIKGSAAWLVAATLIQAVSQIGFFSLGASMVSRLAPPQSLAMMLACWTLFLNTGRSIPLGLEAFEEGGNGTGMLLSFIAVGLFAAAVLFGLDKAMPKAPPNSNETV